MTEAKRPLNIFLCHTPADRDPVRGLPEGTGLWDIYKPLLSQPELAPTKTDITSASAVFREYLQIRKSSKLFRLQTAADISRDLTFLNTGHEQTPGLIVMRLQDNSNLDSNHQELIVDHSFLSFASTALPCVLIT